MSTKQYVLILHYCNTHCTVIVAKRWEHQTITGRKKNVFWTNQGWYMSPFHTCKCSLWKLLDIWFWERSLLARKGWQICVHVHYFRVTLGFGSNDLEKNIPVFLWLSNVFYILLQALSRPMGGQSRAQTTTISMISYEKLFSITSFAGQIFSGFSLITRCA